jgi:hypothetical protein
MRELYQLDATYLPPQRRRDCNPGDPEPHGAFPGHRGPKGGSPTT